MVNPMQVAGLSPGQLANAQRIISIGKGRGESSTNIEIALMTALDESGLRQYANSNVPSSLSYPHDAVGHDHASLGLFQQQTPIWGTVAELMDPNTDVNKFYDALDKVDTKNMTEWAAAQKVQISSDPTGSNYKAQLPTARRIMQALYGSAPSTPDTNGGGVPNPLQSVQNALGAVGTDFAGFATITKTLTDKTFWIRAGWFILGAGLLIIVLSKAFEDKTIDAITGGMNQSAKVSNSVSRLNNAQLTSVQTAQRASRISAKAASDGAKAASTSVGTAAKTAAKAVAETAA